MLKLYLTAPRSVSLATSVTKFSVSATPKPSWLFLNASDISLLGFCNSSFNISKATSAAKSFDKALGFARFKPFTSTLPAALIPTLSNMYSKTANCATLRFLTGLPSILACALI